MNNLFAFATHPHDDSQSLLPPLHNLQAAAAHRRLGQQQFNNNANSASAVTAAAAAATLNNDDDENRNNANNSSEMELLQLLQSVLEEIRDLVDFAENRGNYFIFVHDPHADFVRQTLSSIAHRLDSTKDDIELATKIVVSSSVQRNNNNMHKSNTIGGNNNNNTTTTTINDSSIWDLANARQRQAAAAGSGGSSTNRAAAALNSTTATMGDPAALAERAGVIMPGMNITNTTAATTSRKNSSQKRSATSKRLSSSSGNKRRKTSFASSRRQTKHDNEDSEDDDDDDTPAEDVLPPCPPPANGKEYTKRESIDILSKLTPKIRNRIIVKWIYEKKVPLESSIQMNKILREARLGRTIKMEWRESAATNDNETVLPPPADGHQYTKREAIELLRTMKSTKERNKTIMLWIAEKKIPVLNQGTVISAMQQAEKDPNKITEGWGRWGRGNKAAQDDRNDKTATISTPSYPPPNNGKEYTKLEAINVLSKMTSRDRNKTIGIWIREKMIPITHPISMQRILKEARSNLPMKSINWRNDDTIPYAPPPANGKQYQRQEMVGILAQLKARDRTRLISVWINENKISYKSPATVGNLVRQAIKQTKLANQQKKTTTTTAASAVDDSVTETKPAAGTTRTTIVEDTKDNTTTITTTAASAIKTAARRKGTKKDAKGKAKVPDDPSTGSEQDDDDDAE